MHGRRSLFVLVALHFHNQCFSTTKISCCRPEQSASSIKYIQALKIKPYSVVSGAAAGLGESDLRVRRAGDCAGLGAWAPPGSGPAAGAGAGAGPAWGSG